MVDTSGQMNLFDFTRPLYQIERPIRLIELFSGVGSQAMALRDIGADFESYRTAEWKADSIAVYAAIHCSKDKKDYSDGYTKEQIEEALFRYGISYDGKNPAELKQIKNRSEEYNRIVYNAIIATHDLVNICNAKGADLGIYGTERFTYLLTYSFPCQDLSNAGCGKGMKRGSGTRSGMLWEVERLLKEVEEYPQILWMENVPGVVSEKNIDDFHEWQSFLESIGYTNYFQILNAKDYGVAQNRERAFMVSILNAPDGTQHNYKFPQPVELDKTMDDYLENKVFDSYYIETEAAKALIKDYEERQIQEEHSVSKTIRKGQRFTRPPQMGHNNCINEVGFMEKGTGQHQSNTVFGVDGISPCLNAVNYKEPVKVVKRHEQRD